MMRSMVTKLAYRADQVAEALSISPAAVYRLIRSGELESVQIGGSRRVPADALRAFLDRLRHEPDNGGPDELPPAA